MTDRNSFNKSIQSIAADGKEETGKFIARLKTLTPEEFLRLPRHELERLTMTQYAHVAAAIVPGLDLRRSRNEPNPPPKSQRRVWSLREISIATIVASVIVALGIALAGPIVSDFSGTELVRSTNTGIWPWCMRLTEHIDGCVYMPTQNLNWDYVAHMLDMTVANLLDVNRHLPSTHAPAGEKIVVWRRIGRLEP